MKIVKTITTGKCDWCGKDKPLVVAELQQGNEVALCWTDLKRHILLHFREGQAKKAG